METPRYYVTDIDASHYLFQWMPDWYGVVDEDRGGIVAYFLSEEDAVSFISTLAPAQAGE